MGVARTAARQAAQADEPCHAAPSHGLTLQAQLSLNARAAVVATTVNMHALNVSGQGLVKTLTQAGLPGGPGVDRVRDQWNSTLQHTPKTECAQAPSATMPRVSARFDNRSHGTHPLLAAPHPQEGAAHSPCYSDRAHSLTSAAKARSFPSHLSGCELNAASSTWLRQRGPRDHRRRSPHLAAGNARERTDPSSRTPQSRQK